MPLLNLGWGNSIVMVSSSLGGLGGSGRWGGARGGGGGELQWKGGRVNGSSGWGLGDGCRQVGWLRAPGEWDLRGSGQLGTEWVEWPGWLRVGGGMGGRWEQAGGCGRPRGGRGEARLM